MRTVAQINHYPHHIGDYAKDTMGLSQGQHGAYRLLMDSYYATERPLPDDIDEIYAIARATTPAERKCADRVLQKYFVLEADGYHKNRIDEELAAYRERAETARQNGAKHKAKPKPERTQPEPGGLSDGSEKVSQNETNPVASETPSEPIGSGGKPPAESRDWLFSVGLSMLTETGLREQQARKVIGKWCRDYTDEATIKAMQDVSSRRPADPIAAVMAKLTNKASKRGNDWMKDWANELTGNTESGNVIEGDFAPVH